MNAKQTRVLRGPQGGAEAAAVLRAGGLVAFPTETVYGLGANALDEQAVAGIFAAKGRPADNPLIVHIAGVEMLDRLVKGGRDALPPHVHRLIEEFWPGPLTLILPRREPDVPDAVTAGLDTVAVRMPSHPLAQELIARAGVPVAAPSANRSGRPSATRAEHVLADLDGRIDAVLDGGPAGLGIESTVLDPLADPPVVLRPGGISREQLAKILHRDVTAGWTDGTAVRSPGLKYAHYAPQAELRLYEGGSADAVRRAVQRAAREESAAGRRVGILVAPGPADPQKEDYPGAELLLRAGATLSDLAASLYGRLRQFDQAGIDLVLVEGVWADNGPDDLAEALADRLRRAAGGRVVRVSG